MRSSGLFVLVDHALLHYEEDMLGLANVLRGIAGHSHDIGKFAGFKRADLVGKAKEFGVTVRDVLADCGG